MTWKPIGMAHSILGIFKTMQIFISYKRENEDFARRLREKLLEWRHITWIDVHDIPAGASWADAIEKGLKGSDVVVGVLSPLAVQSQNVKNEWDWAIVHETRLILLMHQDCDVPLNQIRLNYIDCRNEKEAAGLEKLRSALTTPDATAPRPPDEFLSYLQKLYARINTYLGQKIIATLRTDEGMPEPIALAGETTPEAVALFGEQPFDPLLEIGGIELDAPRAEPVHDFQTAFAQLNGRVLLLGEPGAGNTITLLQLGREAVVRRINDAHAPLPILGIIPTWDAQNKTPLAEWLITGDPILRDAGLPIREIMQQGRALLLLDGLDELGGERPVDPNKPDGERFDPRKRFMEGLPAKNQILVTCRRQDYAEIGEKIHLNGAVTLQPLSEAQIRAYLKGTEVLWQAVQNDDGLRKMAETPLLLSFFAFAYHDHPEDAEQLVNLADSPGDLRDAIFERYVQGRYEHEARKAKLRGEKMPFALEEITAYLRQQAFEILNAYDSMQILGFDLNKPLLDFAVRLDYLTLEYAFVHLLLRDYFAYPVVMKTLQEPDKTDGKLSSKISKCAALMDIRVFPHLIPYLTYKKISEPVQKRGFFKRQSEPGKDEHYIESRAIRWSVARQLVRLRDPRVIEPLIEALGDEDQYVQKEAIMGLSSFGDNHAFEPLCTLFNTWMEMSEKEWRRRIWDDSVALLLKAIVLTSRGEEAAYEVVLHAISVDNSQYGAFDIRNGGIEAAGQLSDPRFVPRLIELLEIYQEGWGSVSYHCKYAVKALRKIATPEALDAIKDITCPEDIYPAI